MKIKQIKGKYCDHEEWQRECGLHTRYEGAALDRLHILRARVSPELLVTWQDCSVKAAPYDIFRKDLLGTPVWMEAVQGLETAKLRIIELAGRSPGEYFVYSQESQEIVSETAPRMFGLAF